MHETLRKAKERLTDGAFTCVILDGDREYTSRERGVKPLVSLIQSEESYKGAYAADKTVGAGAAHLYVIIGVKALYANVISESALAVLKTAGIDTFFGECVPYIINRRGDGICPIENAVKGAENSADAYHLILAALERLRESITDKS